MIVEASNPHNVNSCEPAVGSMSPDVAGSCRQSRRLCVMIATVVIAPAWISRFVAQAYRHHSRLISVFCVRIGYARRMVLRLYCHVVRCEACAFNGLVGGCWATQCSVLVVSVGRTSFLWDRSACSSPPILPLQAEFCQGALCPPASIG